MDILAALTQKGIQQTAGDVSASIPWSGARSRFPRGVTDLQAFADSAHVHRPRGNFARPALIATLCSYNVNMEVGIRDAKTKLSKLVEAVLDGQEVFLTNRGARVVQLVRTPKAPPQGRGRGAWKGKIHLYDGWDSRDEDKRIEEMFQTLHEAGPK